MTLRGFVNVSWPHEVRGNWPHPSHAPALAPCAPLAQLRATSAVAG